MKLSSEQLRAIVTGLVVASSITAFFLLRDIVGPNAAVISVLPVAVVAAYYGTKWGLLATSIAFPANVFLLDRESGDLVSPFVSISLLLVAWIFGQLHNLERTTREKSEDQTERLRRLEAGAERNRELLDSVPDTVLRITDAGRIMEMYGERHIGLMEARKDVLFRSVSDAISASWHDELLILAKAAREADSVQTARHDVTVDGESRVIESRVSTAEGGDAVVVARLITGATIGRV